MPAKSPASIAGRGTLRLTINGVSQEVTTDDYERHPSSPILPVLQNTGDIDYSTLTSIEGITKSFDDFSKGAGVFVDTPGKYAIALGLDCRKAGKVFAGPRESIDKTGIPADQRVIKHLAVGTTNWVITVKTAGNGAVFEDSTGVWVDKTAGAGWVAGTPTCIISIGGDIAVGMGNALAFQYTIDSGTNWVSSTNAGSSKYMDRAVFAQNNIVVAKVWYVVNPNLLYNLVSLRNAAVITTSSSIGDTANDAFADLKETDEGVLVIFKRSYIYSIDSNGLVKNIGKQRYKYIATSLSGTNTKQNFNDSVNVDGLLYFRGEDFHLWARFPSGDIRRCEPGQNGDQWPRMKMPITALTKVGDEIWIAMGSVNAIQSVTQSPGGVALLGNQIPVTSDIWAGRYDPSIDDWVWHGVMLASAYLVAYMWYDDVTNLLYLASAVAQAINVSQRRAFVALGDPLTTLYGGIISLNTDAGILELPLFTQSQPNINKTARRVTARSSGLGSTSPTLRHYYRIVEDDVATSFTPLAAAYTSSADARTGTAFPAGATFKGIRLQIVLTPNSGSNTYPVLYNFQLIYLHYPPIHDVMTFSFEIPQGVQATGARSTESMHSLRTFFMSTLKDATDPATLTDLETGESWNVRPEPTWPRERGLGKQRRIEAILHEVVD